MNRSIVLVGFMVACGGAVEPATDDAGTLSPVSAFGPAPPGDGGTCYRCGDDGRRHNVCGPDEVPGPDEGAACPSGADECGPCPTRGVRYRCDGATATLRWERCQVGPGCTCGVAR